MKKNINVESFNQLYSQLKFFTLKNVVVASLALSSTCIAPAQKIPINPLQRACLFLILPSQRGPYLKSHRGTWFRAMAPPTPHIYLLSSG